MQPMTEIWGTEVRMRRFRVLPQVGKQLNLEETLFGKKGSLPKIQDSLVDITLWIKVIP